MTYDFKQGEIILIDKGLDWTSFDIVKKVRNMITRYVIEKEGKKEKIKVGHAGTLDPLATGLMILCTGKNTKRIEEFQDGKKEYIADLTFGGTTPSYDKETEINETFEYEHITKEKIEEQIKSFIGEVVQIPPIFSAKKIDGQRAYKKAHKGEEVKMRSTIVCIDSIEILDFSLPNVKLKIVCGKGTYIRSIAHDLGKKLNSGAYLSGLRRTVVGDFKVEEAHTIEEIQKILTIE